MEIRLNEKEGTHNTLSRIKSHDNCIWPTWVAKTNTPLGIFTEMWATKVILVRYEMEWTMWSVAPLSIIHSLGKRAGGMTRLEEKTEWSKLVEGCKQRGMEVIESRHSGSSKLSILDISKVPTVWKIPDGKGLVTGAIWLMSVAAWWVPRGEFWLPCDSKV